MRFGGLTNRVLELHEGMNLITAPNEWGKSTIAAFLKYAFYGAKQKKSLISDERARALPPGGESAGGSVVFTIDGQRFRLERSGVGREKTALYDDVTGLPQALPASGEPGDAFFGVDGGTFERSVFFYQDAGAVPPHGALEAKLRNLVSTGEEDVSAEKAEKILDEGIRFYQNARGGGRIPQLREEKQAALEAYQKALSKVEEHRRKGQELGGLKEEEKQECARLVRLERQAEEAPLSRYRELERELQEQDRVLSGFVPDEPYFDCLREKWADLQEKQSRLGTKITPRPQKGSLLFPVLCCLLGILLCFAGFWMKEKPFLFPLGGAVLLIGLFWLAVQWKKGQAVQEEQVEKEAQQAFDELKQCFAKASVQLFSSQAAEQEIVRLEGYAQRREEILSELERLESGETLGKNPLQSSVQLQREAVETLRRDIAGREALLKREEELLEDPAAELERQEAIRLTLREAEQELLALREAKRLLGQAHQEMRALFAPALSKRAGSYFEKLTGGAYIGLAPAVDFSLLAQTEGETRPLELLSGGTKVCAYLALRLALSELLFPEELPPLIFDDSFSALDDTRLRLAVALLAEISEKRQVLLFSCQMREKEAYNNKNGIKNPEIEKSV